jgi:hypothetical protein
MSDKLRSRAKHNSNACLPRRSRCTRLELKSGAAFGATLYRVLVLFCATWCDVDIESRSFILLSLFSAVQRSARLCFGQSIRT